MALYQVKPQQLQQQQQQQAVASSSSMAASLGAVSSMASMTNLHTGMPSPPSALAPAAAAPQVLFAAQTVVSQYHPFPVQGSSQLMAHDSRVSCPSSRHILAHFCNSVCRETKKFEQQDNDKCPCRSIYIIVYVCS